MAQKAPITKTAEIRPIKKMSFSAIIKRDFKKHWQLYLIMLPVLAWYLTFCYGPLYGLAAAFQRFNVRKGIAGSPWIGLKNFVDFFESFYFTRVLGNTLRLNLMDLIFAWPSSILFALLLNEIGNSKFKRTVQTMAYLPHFISTVVVCGLIVDFSAVNGVFNDVIGALGGTRISLLTKSNLFTPIYVLSNIWAGMGYGSIIYLAAIGGINSELYEAAMLDGAGRLRQTWHVTLPGLMPTIVTMLIMRIGNILNVGYEKILLLMNDANREAAEVISTFVYQKGLVEASYGYSTAVGLFNSVICLIFLVLANTISRKFSETSLW
ncbi:MAG: ABC transporter permease subunit [Clostridiales bacterium]|nr:ABC transporter permease subunit [Clostridiales bacterium]